MNKTKAVLVFILISLTIIAVLVVAKSKSPTTNTTSKPKDEIKPKSTSGIAGIVLLGPTCPVMRDPPDPQCADKPYQTSLVITTLDGTEVVAKFNSDVQGKFKVSVPAREYTIQSTGTNLYPRCGSDTVNVKAGAFTNTTVSCDTGIR